MDYFISLVNMKYIPKHLIRKRLVGALSLLTSSMRMREFAAYTINYDLNRLVGHDYLLQWYPPNGTQGKIKLESYIV
jgi:hypothetical protein